MELLRLMRVLAGVLAVALCSDVQAAAQSPVNSAPVLARNQQSDEGGYIVRGHCSKGTSCCCATHVKSLMYELHALLAAALAATSQNANPNPQSFTLKQRSYSAQRLLRLLFVLSGACGSPLREPAQPQQMRLIPAAHCREHPVPRSPYDGSLRLAAQLQEVTAAVIKGWYSSCSCHAVWRSPCRSCQASANSISCGSQNCQSCTHR